MKVKANEIPLSDLPRGILISGENPGREAILGRKTPLQIIIQQRRTSLDRISTLTNLKDRLEAIPVGPKSYSG
jgi:hypothetical protein